MMGARAFARYSKGTPRIIADTNTGGRNGGKGQINQASRLASQSLFHHPRLIFSANTPRAKAYTQPLQVFGTGNTSWNTPAGQRSTGTHRKQPSLTSPTVATSISTRMPWQM
jgi:hypothetical protein